MGVVCTFAVILACSIGTCARVGWDVRLGRGRGGGSNGVGRWMGNASRVTGCLLRYLRASSRLLHWRLSRGQPLPAGPGPTLWHLTSARSGV